MTSIYGVFETRHSQGDTTGTLGCPELVPGGHHTLPVIRVCPEVKLFMSTNNFQTSQAGCLEFICLGVCG